MDLYDNTESVNKLNSFWESAKIEINNIKTDQMTFKSQELPLARIKKIMKLDEDVKSMMISAEAPILFAKAAELFIREITLRAWIHTERNKRRTLQRSDITLAVADGDTDQFDFLIDIVPRDEIKSHGTSTKREETTHGGQTIQQVSGGINLFGGNTIQLNTQSLNASQPTLLSSIVDSNSLTANIIQAAQPTQSTATIQNQQPQQMQYVLQLPIGPTAGSMSAGQTIQIQMIPQQTILSNAGTDNTATTLTTASGATVINGPQAQQIFAIGGGQGNQGTATVVLQPGLLAGTQATPIYTTTTASLDASTVAAAASTTIVQQASVPQPSISTVSTVETDQVTATQFVAATIKRDVDESSVNHPEVI